jgi:catechol 2,3-dioxygenase-like lactoylglutathione lyase family enzyme
MRADSAFQAIRAIDYTVIFVRDMKAMRCFYEDVLGFALSRELSAGWIEYRVGGNTLALARPSLTAADGPTPSGSAALQLSFKVSASDVDRCADELVRQGIHPISPPTNQVFGTARCSSGIRMEICWKCLRRFSWSLSHTRPSARAHSRSRSLTAAAACRS